MIDDSSLNCWTDTVVNGTDVATQSLNLLCDVRQLPLNNVLTFVSITKETG